MEPTKEDKPNFEEYFENNKRVFNGVFAGEYLDKDDFYSYAKTINAKIAELESNVKVLKDAMIWGTNMHDTLLFDDQEIPLTETVRKENKRLKSELDKASKLLFWTYTLYVRKEDNEPPYNGKRQIEDFLKDKR